MRIHRGLVAVCLAVPVLAGCAPGGPTTSSTASDPDVAVSASAPTDEPGAAASSGTPSSGQTGVPSSARGPYAVTRVVDGDTIWVRVGGQRVKVRLIGIDTPETVKPGEPVACFGPEASARAKQLLSGTRVRLELDASQGRLDRYGRTLAYVWMADGRLFNEVMVREGYAREYTYDDPYRYQRRFRAAEDAARVEGLGLWSACG